MIQIKDVARLAKVSTGSVSKVLNSSSGVSQRMREKVENAIEQLGYRPNMVARSLRTKTTNTVAIIVPYTNDPYFVEFFRGISMELRRIDCIPLLYSSEPAPTLTMDEIRQLVMRGVDGLIVSTYGWAEETLQELIKISDQIPVVSFKRTFPGTPIHSVNVDDLEGMYTAVRHLTSIGHRRIGYLSAGLGLETGQQRMQGYMKALKEADIAFDEQLIVHCESFSISDGYVGVQQLMKRYPFPTAVVGANDAVAIGALKYLETRNVKIPESIAVMGYDDVPLSTMVSPPLSSVALPVYEMTAECVSIIEQALKGYITEPVNRLFSSRLVIRNSTDFSANIDFDFGRFVR